MSKSNDKAANAFMAARTEAKAKKDSAEQEASALRKAVEELVVILRREVPLAIVGEAYVPGGSKIHVWGVSKLETDQLRRILDHDYENVFRDFPVVVKRMGKVRAEPAR